MQQLRLMAYFYSVRLFNLAQIGARMQQVHSVQVMRDPRPVSQEQENAREFSLMIEWLIEELCSLLSLRRKRDKSTNQGDMQDLLGINAVLKMSGYSSPSHRPHSLRWSIRGRLWHFSMM